MPDLDGHQRARFVMGLKHLRLTTRLYAGIGVLVALAVGIAGFGIDRLSRVGAQVAVTSVVVEYGTRIDELVLNLETIVTPKYPLSTVTPRASP